MNTRPLHEQEVTLAILAGGEGSRLGVPKARMKLAGVCVLQFLHDRMAWKGPTMVVTAPGRENPPGADRFDREVTDQIAGLGPLQGILTGLQNAATQWVLFCTVDMPLVDRPTLDLLLQHETPSVARAFEVGSRREPFPCLVNVSTRSIAREMITAGDLRIMHFLNRADCVAVHPPASWSLERWMNLNTPSDLDRLRSIGIAVELSSD